MLEIVVMQAEPTPKAKKHIAERVAADKCLCCEGKSVKRGLCLKCYYKWRSLRATLGSAAKKASFDAKLMRIGKLLAQQAVRSFRGINPFASAADEV